MSPKITVHCIVRNEQKWVWFALCSVLDIAEKILVYDTRSTDKTVEIIKTIKNKKIIFEQKGKVDAKELVELRSQQLKATNTQWFLILDGDEIWPQETKKELLVKLKSAKENDWGVVVRVWNLVGDVYHYHPESIRYRWPFAPKDYQGWANLRVFRKSVVSEIKGKYPLEAYCDDKGIPIQNYGLKHLIFLKNRFFHATYLRRSTSRKIDNSTLNRSGKLKSELGLIFPKDFKYPEVFYQKRPKIVDDPWQKRTRKEILKATINTPFKELRRRIFRLYNP